MAEDQTLKAFDTVVKATEAAGLPGITFARKTSIYFNHEEIELRHFPKSHTSGDIAAYFKQAKVLHLGDLYFNGMFPFVDLAYGGNVNGMINSIEYVLANYPEDTKIIPGHGAVSDMTELKAYLDMLKQTSAAVLQSKNEGMSLAAIQEKGLDEQWASWSWALISTETWVAQVYGSL